MSEKKELSQESKLYALCEGLKFIQCERETYAKISVGNHVEIHNIQGESFQNWVLERFQTEHGMACRQTSLATLKLNLHALASREGAKEFVHKRIVRFGNRVYIDLCNPDWEVVEITPDGWSVIPAPVNFHRPSSCQPLPTPIRGGSIDDLRPLVNIGTPENWTLLWAWVLGTFNTVGACPLLSVRGCQGSAKSTLTRLLKRLLDPSTMREGGGMPATDEAFSLAAHNNYLLWFDNLSWLTDGMSDILCRVATGGSFTKRLHYQNTDQFVVNIKNPVMLTSINDLIHKDDLVSRTVFLDIDILDSKKRVSEDYINNEFERIQPRLMGAIYEVIAACLKNYDSVVFKESPPRLADFAQWATAGESALGFPAGSIVGCLNSKIARYTDDLYENNLIVRTLAEMVKKSGGVWTGTKSEILEKVNEMASFTDHDTLPKNPIAMGNLLKRMTPCLTQKGFTLTDQPRKAGCRPVKVEYKAPPEISDLVNVPAVDSRDNQVPMTPDWKPWEIKESVDAKPKCA